MYLNPLYDQKLVSVNLSKTSFFYTLDRSSLNESKFSLGSIRPSSTLRSENCTFSNSMVNPLDISRLNPGIRNRHNFFLLVIFYFKKLELILGMLRFSPISWESDFEISAQLLNLRGRNQYAWVFHS